MLLTLDDDFPIKQELKLVSFLLNWRTWISGRVDYSRPTEEAAFKRLRDKALLTEALEHNISLEYII